MIKLTVIIPVYNDAVRLERCLEALTSAQEISDGVAKCVVVDNGSAVSLTELVGKFPGVTFVEEPRPGSYTARNFAAKSASSEYLAFTDSDCVPEHDWISEAIRILDSDTSVDILAGDIRLFPDVVADMNVERGVVAYEKATAFRQEYYVNVVHFGPTANLFVRKSVFDALEGFNEKLLSGGDKDFGVRAWRSGYELRYAPECVVHHPARFTSTQLKEKARRLVGGEHYKADGRFISTVIDLGRYICLRLLKALQLIWVDFELSVAEKFAASGVALRVVGWQVTEKMRLMRGSQPQR